MTTNTDDRQAIITACLEMNDTGLNQGTSGNISVRAEAGLLITPSAQPYNEMAPDDIVYMPNGAEYGAFDGRRRPSSEWRFHYDIMASRPDIGAIVHTHSTYATVLSMLRKEIPACHYMIAAFGGPTIRCADYAIFGSAELSTHALAALDGRTGCLLASHGMIACGSKLKEAMWRAVELETLAKQYHLSLQLGEPVLMSDEHISEVAERMKTGYGVWSETI
jgi:L-fuculose-phosphate aldolase